LVNFIANLLREDLVRTTNMATGLTVDEQVKIALRFCASWSFLQVIGDTLGVTFPIDIRPFVL
jgi:hypothetical protein